LDNFEKVIFRRAFLRGSLSEWAHEALRDFEFTPARHHQLLIEELTRLSKGEFARLMVLMPPGSAKSTYAFVNTDLWGAFIGTPSTAGTYFMWAEGTDGSAVTVFSTSFVVQ
jgi:hypothetical protein